MAIYDVTDYFIDDSSGSYDPLLEPDWGPPPPFFWEKIGSTWSMTTNGVMQEGEDPIFFYGDGPWVMKLSPTLSGHPVKGKNVTAIEIDCHGYGNDFGGYFKLGINSDFYSFTGYSMIGDPLEGGYLFDVTLYSTIEFGIFNSETATNFSVDILAISEGGGNFSELVITAIRFIAIDVEHSNQLYKNTGRSMQTQIQTNTRLVWVEDSITPPITPPIATITPPPPDSESINIFIGPTIQECIKSDGSQGHRIWYYPPTGNGYPLTSCF